MASDRPFSRHLCARITPRPVGSARPVGIVPPLRGTLIEEVIPRDYSPRSVGASAPRPTKLTLPLRQWADPASLSTHVSLGLPRRNDDFGIRRSLDGKMVKMMA